MSSHYQIKFNLANLKILLIFRQTSHVCVWILALTMEIHCKLFCVAKGLVYGEDFLV